jgi:hypothetical protein
MNSSMIVFVIVVMVVKGAFMYAILRALENFDSL